MSSVPDDEEVPRIQGAHSGTTNAKDVLSPLEATSSNEGTPRTGSTGSEDKGKGKAVEEGPVEGGGTADARRKDTREGSTPEASSPDVDRARQDLQLLANLDPSTAERLVELDPTPTSNMLTTTKLMKAISLLTSACRFTAEYSDYGSRSSDALPLSTYGEIVQLLTEAMNDVNQSNSNLRSPPKSVALHHLEVARAKLSLPLQDAVPPRGPTDEIESIIAVNGFGQAAHISLPSTPSELSLIYAENSRIALAALRPVGLFGPLSYGSTTENSQIFSPTDSPVTGPSPLAKLPSELLLYILHFAHAAAAEPPANDMASQAGGSSRSSAVAAEVWNGRSRRAARDEYGNPINGISGSNGAAQRFTLALARVSRAWVEPARTVAFRHLHLHQASQIEQLLSTLRSSPSLKLALPSIQAISATLAPPGSHEQSAGPGGAGVSLNRLIGRITGRRGRPAAATEVNFGGRPGGSSREGSVGGKGEGGGVGGAAVKEEEKKTPAENWSQLVEFAPNVKSLKLKIIPNANRWAGFSRNPTTTEFLDAAVLGTLSSTRSLKHLNLEFSIDFEELEVIMNGLPNLETLSIQAIDAISGSLAVNSTSPHPARKIRQFKLGDMGSNSPYQIQEYSAISDVQLAWLLEPAVTNGSFKDLEIAILIDPGVGGVWPPGLPGGPAVGANQNAPPFASSTVADLLVRCGGNLERLVLQDLAENGSVNPNFAAAPHNSNFDHALSSLPSLRELSLQFSYTGANFLASLSSIPHLRTLALSGTPVHTSADLFADKLEHGLGELETLTISGQFAGTRGGQGGWNGAGVRRVKQAAKERGLQGAFGA